VERTHCNREVERVGRGWKISRLSCAAITENALQSLLWRQSLENASAVLIAGWATKKLKIVPSRRMEKTLASFAANGFMTRSFEGLK